MGDIYSQCFCISFKFGRRSHSSSHKFARYVVNHFVCFIFLYLDIQISFINEYAVQISDIISIAVKCFKSVEDTFLPVQIQHCSDFDRFLF